LQEAAALCTTLLPSDLSGASVELAEYLKDAFGNATRIDYGSGHETNFVAVLCALFVLGVYTPGDRLALALVVFPRYVYLPLSFVFLFMAISAAQAFFCKTPHIETIVLCAASGSCWTTQTLALLGINMRLYPEPWERFFNSVNCPSACAGI
jgi:hypothetical protein